ncbi:Ada metal-binding domain-containing protein [Candidatus Hodarchaeum mangrovi]
MPKAHSSVDKVRKKNDFSLMNKQELLKAIYNCDPDFNGLFYFGVKTTHIYCLPSCKAKRPLSTNIVLFETKELAEKAGYRGCLRCKAADFPDTTPPWLKNLVNKLNKIKNRRVTRKEFENITGVEITTIREQFRKIYRETPVQYHRKVRLNYAMTLIKSGMNTSAAGLQSGFKSSSGFRQAFIKEFGVNPGVFSYE